LTARTIFRTVEYWTIADQLLRLGKEEGFDPMSLSPVIRYEWYFYVFEAVLMLCNQVLMNVRHPRRWLPKSTKTYLAQDGVTEIDGPGYKDTRPFWQTLVDPFDLLGLLSKGNEDDKTKRFWEGNGFDGASKSKEVRREREWIEMLLSKRRRRERLGCELLRSGVKTTADATECYL